MKKGAGGAHDLSWGTGISNIAAMLPGNSPDIKYMPE